MTDPAAPQGEDQRDLQIDSLQMDNALLERDASILRRENAKLREALEEYQRGQECDYGPSDKPCPGTPDFAPCLFHRARAALDPSSTGTR